MADGQLESAHFLAAKGDRAWKNKRMVKALRDTRSLQVMEVLLGDEHTFDCWVSYQLPNGKVTAIKPKLVAWIDAKEPPWCWGISSAGMPMPRILKQSILLLVISYSNTVSRRPRASIASVPTTASSSKYRYRFPALPDTFPGWSQFFDGTHHSAGRHSSQFSGLDSDSILRKRAAVMSACYLSAVKHYRYLIPFLNIGAP